MMWYGSRYDDVEEMRKIAPCGPNQRPTLSHFIEMLTSYKMQVSGQATRGTRPRIDGINMADGGTGCYHVADPMNIRKPAR